jgi:hypothetical protein
MAASRRLTTPAPISSMSANTLSIAISLTGTTSSHLSRHHAASLGLA